MLTDPMWTTALVAATAAHAGFQLTVTVLVYPALVAVPAERWAVQHAAHSRRIVPIVAMVYLAVLVALTGRLLAGPGPAVLACAGASAVVFALTAGFAAPVHTRLGAGPDPVLLRRLLVVDRLRSLGAGVGFLAALLV